MQRLGIFGGSFDPPHLGHLALVQAALNELELDEVWVIPVGMAVHKTLSKDIAASERFQWVSAMFAEYPHVRVLDWEVLCKHPIASIETMKKVCAQTSLMPIWLMGMDVWKDMPNWVDYPSHQRLCDVAVFPRENETMVVHHGWKEVDDAMLLAQSVGGKVYAAQTCLPDISATQVRQAILTDGHMSNVLHAQSVDEIKAAYHQAAME